MSIVPMYKIYCDVCRRVGPGPMGGSADRQEERRLARKAGWKRYTKGWHGDVYSKGEDLCPVCARQRGFK